MSEPRLLPTVKWQHKLLSSNITVDGTMSDLTFNNLEVGKHYRVSLQASIVTDGIDSVDISITHNSATIGFIQSREGDITSTDQETSSVVSVFKATATTLTFVAVSIGPGSLIAGNNTRGLTYATLEELPLHQETTKWT